MTPELSLEERLRERNDNVAIVRRIITVSPWLYTAIVVVAGTVAFVSTTRGHLDDVALTVAITSVPTAFLCWLSRMVAEGVLNNLDLCHPPEEPADSPRDAR